MRFKIEKNIPIPSKGKGLFVDVLKAMTKMRVNNSFFISAKDAPVKQATQIVFSCQRSIKNNKKHKTRKYIFREIKGPLKVTGSRVWRVK